MQDMDKGVGNRVVVIVPEIMVKVPSDNLGAVRMVITLLQEKFTYFIALPLTRCHGNVMGMEVRGESSVKSSRA